MNSGCPSRESPGASFKKRPQKMLPPKVSTTVASLLISFFKPYAWVWGQTCWSWGWKTITAEKIIPRTAKFTVGLEMQTYNLTGALPVPPTHPPPLPSSPRSLSSPLLPRFSIPPSSPSLSPALTHLARISPYDISLVFGSGNRIRRLHDGVRYLRQADTRLHA